MFPTMYFIAVKLDDMLNKWAFLLTLVEMTCFSFVDALLVPFFSTLPQSSLMEHTGIDLILYLSRTYFYILGRSYDRIFVQF